MNVQVLVNGRGAEPEEAAACVGTLLRSVRRVELMRTPDLTRLVLEDRYGATVLPGQHLRTGVPVVVTSARVLFASGAVRRIVKHTLVEERTVTRIFVPGLTETEQVTCWSPAWLRSYDGDVADLLDAGLAFDREHLQRGSPTARSWVRADQVGLSLGGDVEGKVAVWAARTGAELDMRRWWDESVRAPAGVARRRMARRRQRRHQSSVSPPGR